MLCALCFSRATRDCPRRRRAGATEPLQFDAAAVTRARLAALEGDHERAPERVTYTWPDEPVFGDEDTKI